MYIVSYLKHIFEKFLLPFFLEFLLLVDPSWIPSQGSQWSPRSPVFRTLRKERLDDSHLAAILETARTFSILVFAGCL